MENKEPNKDSEDLFQEEKYTFYSPQDLTKEKKKNVNLMLLLAIFLFLVAAGVGLLYFYEQQQFKEDRNIMKEEMQELNTQLDQIKEERERLESETEFQSEELDKLKRKLLDKERRIRGLIKIGRKYDQAQTEIGELRDLNIEYLKKIDSLLIQNKQLNQEVTTLRASLSNAIKQNSTLIQELNDEQEKPKIKDDISQLNFVTSNYKTQAIRSIRVGKVEETNKSKKVTLLRSCFLLSEKEQTNRTHKVTLIIRYTSPNGKVMNPNPELNAPVIIKGLERAITLKRTLNFKKKKDVCLNFEPVQGYLFKKGIYISEVFLTENEKDFYLLASDRLSLK